MGMSAVAFFNKMTNWIKTLKRTLNIQKSPNFSNSITGSEKKCRLLSIAAVIDEDWHKRRHWGARRGEKVICGHAVTRKPVQVGYCLVRSKLAYRWDWHWPVSLPPYLLVPSDPAHNPLPHLILHLTTPNQHVSNSTIWLRITGERVFFWLKIGSFSCQFAVGVRLVVTCHH